MAKSDATQLGIAQIPVRATLDELGKDLEQARNKVESAMGSIAKRISGDYLDLGHKVTVGLAGAGAALAAVGATAAGVLSKLAIDALPLVQVQGAFEGISGGAEEMLAALRKGSYGMVTNTELMKSYNSAAQLVGKTFADQLPNAMQYLAKVSAATGQDMGFMLDSLVKGVGRISPMILDNLGIQVSLAEATDRAAQMYGKEADDLSKAEIQAGMMNVVLEKLATNTEKMPEVAGSAAQKWEALKVSMQNLKDDAGVALIPVLERILTPLGTLAENVLPKVSEKFNEAVDTIDRVVYLFMGIPELVQAANGDFDTLTGLLEGRLLKIADVIGLPDEKIRPLMDDLRELGSTIATFVSENVIPFVETHGPDLKAAFEAVATFLATAAIASTIVGIGSALLGLLQPINLVIGAVALLAVAWKNDWGGIQEKTAAAWAEIKKVLDAVVDAYNAIKSAIQGAIDKWREWTGRQNEADAAAQENPVTGTGVGKGAYYRGNYASGGDFVVSRPTMLLAGEAYQPERVTVTPLSSGQAGDEGEGFHFHYYDYSGVNYNRAQSMAREWEYKYEMGLYGR